MKKKTRATAQDGAKRRKTVMAQHKAASLRASRPRLSVAHNGAKPTIRGLKTELARAVARIEELEASADTDFLLAIHNRRGFERELNRSIAYIKRYNASGALIVLDVDRLKPINDAFGHAAGDQGGGDLAPDGAAGADDEDGTVMSHGQAPGAVRGVGQPWLTAPKPHL